MKRIEVRQCELPVKIVLVGEGKYSHLCKSYIVKAARKVWGMSMNLAEGCKNKKSGR